MGLHGKKMQRMLTKKRDSIAEGITEKSQQLTLFNKSLDEEAITVIKEHEPQKGYWLAFSGGKDSIVIYDLAVRAGVKFEAHYAMTTVDPPEVMRFIREHYPDVIWDRPKKSMFQIIANRKTPPTRFRRYCCTELKEIGGKGWVVMTGVRSAENPQRRNYEVFVESKRKRGKWLLNPIIGWKNSDVWSYIHARNLPYCELYNRGRSRLGCILCPVQDFPGKLLDMIEYPRYVRAYVRAFDRMLQNIPEDECGEWKTGEDVFVWWLTSDQYIQNPALDKTALDSTIRNLIRRKTFSDDDLQMLRREIKLFC